MRTFAEFVVDRDRGLLFRDGREMEFKDPDNFFRSLLMTDTAIPLCPAFSTGPEFFHDGKLMLFIPGGGAEPQYCSIWTLDKLPMLIRAKLVPSGKQVTLAHNNTELTELNVMFVPPESSKLLVALSHPDATMYMWAVDGRGAQWVLPFPNVYADGKLCLGSSGRAIQDRRVGSTAADGIKGLQDVLVGAPWNGRDWLVPRDDARPHPFTLFDAKKAVSPEFKDNWTDGLTRSNTLFPAVMAYMSLVHKTWMAEHTPEKPKKAAKKEGDEKKEASDE